MQEISEVTWVDASRMSVDNSVVQKLGRLLEESRVMAEVTEGMRVALKINTAEDGYEFGLRPVFYRVVAEAIRRAAGAGALLCDGLKLVDYWRRAKGTSFMDVARGRGYIDAAIGGSLVINGGFSGDEGNIYQLALPDAVLGGVEVGSAVCRSDALLVLSHVTLHPLFGVSGALANGGFECLVGRERLRVLDGIDPYPFDGRKLPPDRLTVFHRRALEGNLGVREALEGNAVYINYLWDVTPQPEYFPFSFNPVFPNLGFLASRDPVALDAATYALLAEGPGGFRAGFDPVQEMTGVAFPAVLARAEALGIGSRDYTVKQLT
jgi:uncharacterized Fe-S center protein